MDLRHLIARAQVLQQLLLGLHSSCYKYEWSAMGSSIAQGALNTAGNTGKGPVLVDCRVQGG